MNRTVSIGAAVALAALVAPVSAQESKTINTRIGTLTFESGYPSKQTVATLYDAMDFQRATQAYLWAIPAVGVLQWKHASDDIFKVPNGQFVTYTTFDEKLGILTPNVTTPYIVAIADLKKSGPMVFDVPKGLMAGMILDVWQRVLSDVGVIGPDKGNGGKFLVLPPGHAKIRARGYHVIRSPSNTILVGVRLLDPDREKAVLELAPKLRSYPWSERRNPPAGRIAKVDDKKWSQMPPRGMAYWDRVAELVQNEPAEERDRFILAQLRFLGIEKGKPFNPDERQKKLLTEAAIVGEAMAKTNTSDKRIVQAFWPDTHWKEATVVSINQRAQGYDQFDGRAAWFYEAVTISKAMLTQTPGVGQRYIAAYQDKAGNWLSGENTYRLHVPANPPVEQFWSVTAYDEDTRQMVVNDAKKPDVSSRNPDLIKNADGTVDVYFGPHAPSGPAKNWVQTLPGKGYFLYFRFYAPTKAFFDKSWVLNDVEKISPESVGSAPN
jgi:hypothetical protein